MSVSLDYRTTAAVPIPVKVAIEAEVPQIRPPHNWWAEAINLFDTGVGDGRLFVTVHAPAGVSEGVLAPVRAA